MPTRLVGKLKLEEARGIWLSSVYVHSGVLAQKKETDRYGYAAGHVKTW